MKEIIGFLEYGVLGFCVVAIIYSCYVVKHEQKRKEGARQNVIDFATNILKYSLGFALVIGLVQVIENKFLIHSPVEGIEELESSNEKHELRYLDWSKGPSFIPVPNAFDQNNQNAFQARQKSFHESIISTLNICGNNVRISYPLTAPMQPAGESDYVTIDNQNQSRGLRFEFVRVVEYNTQTVPVLEQEYSTLDVPAGSKVSVSSKGSIQINPVPIRCL